MNALEKLESSKFPEKGTIEVIRINKNTEIIQAQKFLYEQYIINMGWKIPDKSPTKWTIKEVDGKKVLCDRYSNSSLWYVSKNEDKVINSCIRVVFRDKSKNLDIENYNFSHSLRNFIDNHDNCVELTRFAFANNEHFAYYYCTLLLSIFSDSLLEKWTIILTDGLGNKDLYRRLQIPKIEGATFKYDVDDDEETNTFGITYRNIPALINNCRRELNLIKSS